MRMASTAMRVLIAILVASAVNAATPQELTDAAKERAAAAKARASRVKPAVMTDPRVQEPASLGIARGEQELERRAANLLADHDAAVSATKVPDAASGSSQAPTRLLPGRLVVALSSSMPDELVREYLRQLDDLPEAVVVLRGFVGGAKTVGPTGVWLERVRRKLPSCSGRECGYYRAEIVVDPLAYRMLGIAKVPAFAYLPGVQDLRHCDAESLVTGSVAYGSVSVAAALRAVRAKDVDVPEDLIKRVGG